MPKAPIFRGVATALITPFRQGEIDYPALTVLIERQLAAGIPALVIGGTTGEAATLTDDERYRLYSFAMERIAGRAKVILGTGTNDTRTALSHTRRAARLGADAALVVTPYYNKGTHDGLITHYRTIAEEGGIPIMLYNVPSRTGVSLSLKQLDQLSSCEQICGIKEASDSAERLVQLAARRESLTLYAGNDSATYTVLSLGGCGVISVLSNLFPSSLVHLTEAYAQGKWQQALNWQLRLLPLMQAMFRETNPAPVKYAASCLGLCTSELRLPLCAPVAATCQHIRALLQDASLS